MKNVFILCVFYWKNTKFGAEELKIPILGTIKGKDKILSMHNFSCWKCAVVCWKIATCFLLSITHDAIVACGKMIYRSLCGSNRPLYMQSGLSVESHSSHIFLPCRPLSHSLVLIKFCTQGCFSDMSFGFSFSKIGRKKFFEQVNVLV